MFNVKEFIEEEISLVKSFDDSPKDIDSFTGYITDILVDLLDDEVIDESDFVNTLREIRKIREL